MEQYARWLGAKPVVNGVPMETPEQAADAPDQRLAREQVEAIRCGLHAGVDRVTCDCRHAPTVTLIRSLLTTAELERVSFTVEGIPLNPR